MNIICNGETIVVQDKIVLRKLLEIKKLNEQKGIAVAVNENVIPKGSWDKIDLKENDNVLIITATKGG